MFLADCHTHSRVSPDSNAPMVEMAKAAWEYGLDVMCLTDHCDLLSLEGERTLTYDWGPVLRERKGMLDAFGARVDLPLGLEFGMAHLFPEAAETILRQPGLDFVIGSCHNQDEKAGGRTSTSSPTTPWTSATRHWTITSPPCCRWRPPHTTMWWATSSTPCGT